MPNPFVHAELASTNVPKARAFYAKMFKWKFIDRPMHTAAGNYTMIDVGDGVGGGMLHQLIPGADSAWMPYVHVKDIKVATQKARKLRAKVCKGVTEVKGMGWFSIIVDPTGAMLGLWQPKNS